MIKDTFESESNYINLIVIDQNTTQLSFKCISYVQRLSLLFLSDYIQNNYMNIEDRQIENSRSSSKSKILGVIVLTDNRINNLNDKSNTPHDLRCSAYKETQADPLQFTIGGPRFYDDDLFAQLTRRVCMLEERVEALSKLQEKKYSGEEINRKDIKRKKRRRFKELARSILCPTCQKVYGSDTALKYHIKLKHNLQNNHFQEK